ncbi:hypothetical protein T265_11397 [Opisthorchis viverrini]|uniref:Reverse transcriptase/retrotransposon-derived protein RNase H-like domain-containing protein n=1 Tax=Opisthorchis viverrini TaxID=6198 RepID=A0A074Z351_OPIVI|nr:hypothetical protein T265_11397 [Opisthorchis viverrini]KER19952.1 hypothetical protein T265_11397 [Opisthorchis viverrini]
MPGRFSDKIYPITHNTTFPVPESVIKAFESLKKELMDAALVTIDPRIPLVLETNASDVAISAL